MIRLVSLACLVVIAFSPGPPLVWAQPAGATVRVEPATLDVQAGDAVEITIVIENASNLGAFQFDFTYDPAIVRVDGITLGDFAASTGRSVNPLGPRMEAGRAMFGAFSFGDSAGPDGNGTLAMISLTAQAGGETPLGLENVQVVDIGGTRLPTSSLGGKIAVSGEPPAEPQATVPAQIEPTRVSTATPGIPLPTPQAELAPVSTRDSAARDWLIVVVVLLGVVGVVVLAAYRMGR